MAAVLAATFLVGAIALTSCGSTRPTALPGLRSAVRPAPSIRGGAAVHGRLTAPGGPFLYDHEGRVVFLHGVNAVYKRPPFELYPADDRPWSLTASDASLMARLGFNVVRLGMTWKGLEPGTAPPNDPAICGQGRPHDPGQFDRAVLDGYLARLARTVDLLGRFHIYTLLDMHQDVYNEAFDGEGAPNWAVCTGGAANRDPPGRWSRNYGTAAADTAFGHFWSNDVAGDLQGEYDRVWGAVAAYFKDDPWVVGYDPFNEPFSTALVLHRDEQFDSALECFYTGRAVPHPAVRNTPSLPCPVDDPAMGVIPSIRAADADHLIFFEPDIYGSRGYPNFVGPMPFPGLVFNVHVYCGKRSPKTGNPVDIQACAAQELRTLKRRLEDRSELSSHPQPRGPAWVVSEFGATSDPRLLDELTAAMDRSLVGWAYWSWKFYDDPTGSSAEALVMPGGSLRPTARALSRTYAQAIAGTPLATSFDPTSADFSLVYRSDPTVHAPTVIFIPTALHYPAGYCARVSGGRVTSPAGAELLTVAATGPGHGDRPIRHPVHVTVVPGACS